MLFFIGIIEMLIISAWTKAVTEAQVLVSGIVTLINVFIWYFVLQQVVNDLGNIWVVASYAIGCALGTVISTLYFRQRNIKKQLKTEANLATGMIVKQEN
jgi:RsiW-degrading membrane proteinase PrsW (M82 family)